MNWLKRLFKRKGDEEEMTDATVMFDGPLFEVGDRVLIVNPNLVEPSEEPPEAGYIEAVIHLPEIDEYTYKLTGHPFYYNENWLQEDIFGPLYYSVHVVDPADERRGKIDALLDEYRDYKALVDTFGDAEYGERLAEIEAELRRIGETK